MPLVLGNTTNKEILDEVNKSAKLDGNNTFTGNNVFNGTLQVQNPTENEHASTKQYVDTKFSQLEVGSTIDSTTKVKEDLTFTEHEGLYKYEIEVLADHVIIPIRLLKEQDSKLLDVLFHVTYESNKCIIWTSVETIKKLIYFDSLTKQADLGNVARLNAVNTFDETITFAKNPVCTVEPTDDNQLANKKYIDDSLDLANTTAQQASEKAETATQAVNLLQPKVTQLEGKVTQLESGLDTTITTKVNAKFPIIEASQRPEDVLTENGQYCFQIVG